MSLQEVAPGTFAWLQLPGTWGESNAGLVVGDGASLLVDTLWDHVRTRTMLDAMAERVGHAPIRAVVNTHSDGDHWWGNALAPADAELWTSAASLEVMGGEDPRELVRFQRLAGGLARLPGGVGAFGRYVRAMLGPFAFSEVELRRPRRTFSGEQDLDAGGRAVRLIEVGPAHTPGDLIVHVPDARVVFAADVLFVGSTPVVWAGPVERWLAALDTILGLEADAYVPGHGPVCGRDEVEAVRAYWEWLRAEATERHAEGMDAWATAREIARSPEFARAPWRHWRAPERLVINVQTIFRNLDGEPPSSSPVATMRLFSRVAALGGALRG
jgi:cyclase